MSEILDEGMGRLIPDYISAKTEYLFSPPGIYAGYGFMILGVVSSVLTVSAVGVFGILLGVFLSLTHYGVKLDTANKRLKQYFSVFGIRTGKWEDVYLYPYLCIMKSNTSYTAYGQTSIGSTYSDTSFDVYILDKTHRNKIKLQTFSDQEKALANAKALAQKVGIEYTIYNPPISAKTKSRRR